jgi:short-subunit dehydrogenase
MGVQLKKLSEQVIVITGASSGIGLATAEAAARRGAKLVLAARSENTLEDVVKRIIASGSRAIAVTCDVSDRTRVDHVAEAAVRRFGRIDTWVNNAGLGIYGRLDETKDVDARRLFDINFWGVVNGCQAALPYLKKNGGALITVGSEVSETYAPLMGIYVATKHAVKGYVDVLRLEVEDIDRAPVSIALIQPTAVNTPFPQHARNYTPQEASLPKPMIEPRQVADAILDAAVNPTRDRRVGAMGRVNATVAALFPAVADHMADAIVDNLHNDEPARNPDGALNRPSEAIGVAGQTHGNDGRKSK